MTIDQSNNIYSDPRAQIRNLLKKGKTQEALEISQDAIKLIHESHSHYPHLEYRPLTPTSNQLISVPITRKGEEYFSVKGIFKLPETEVNSLKELKKKIYFSKKPIEVKAAEMNEIYDGEIIRTYVVNEDSDVSVLISSTESPQPIPIKIFSKINEENVDILRYTLITPTDYQEPNNTIIYTYDNISHRECLVNFSMDLIICNDNREHTGVNFDMRIREEHRDSVSAWLSIVSFEHFNNQLKKNVCIEDINTGSISTFTYQGEEVVLDDTKPSSLIFLRRLRTIEEHFNINFVLPNPFNFTNEDFLNVLRVYSSVKHILLKSTESQDHIRIEFKYEEVKKGVQELELIRQYGETAPEKLHLCIENGDHIRIFNYRFKFNLITFIGDQVNIIGEKNTIDRLKKLEEDETKTVKIRYKNLKTIYENAYIYNQ